MNVSIGCSLPVDFALQLEKLAGEKGISKAAFAADIVKDWLINHNKNNPKK